MKRVRATEEMIDEYIKWYGTRCPNCHEMWNVNFQNPIDLNPRWSETLVLEHDNNGVDIDIECPHCGARWVEYLEIKGIGDLRIPDEDKNEPSTILP